MLTASVACDRASRWVFMSTKLFVWPGRKGNKLQKNSDFYNITINIGLPNNCGAYRTAGVGPPKVHSCVKLNQGSAVHGEGLPH